MSKLSIIPHAAALLDYDGRKIADVLASLEFSISFTFQGGRWARSGVGSAMIGSDRRLIRSTSRDGSNNILHGAVKIAGTLDGVTTIGADGRWERCGKTSARVGSNRRLMPESVPGDILSLSGRWARSGASYALVGSDRRLLTSVPAQAATVQGDVYTAYLADEGGEAAVFVENTATGARSRVSSAGSDASALQFDGRGNVIWSAPANARGAIGGQYFASLSADAQEHAFRPIPKLACWGDSLTAQDWMANLAAAGTAATYYNFGRSADTSLAVVSRMGAVTTTYAVDGYTIPASGPVLIYRTGEGDPLQKIGGVDNSLKGYLNGVWGTFTRTGGVDSFTRAIDGAPVPVAGDAVFRWGYSATGDAEPADESAFIEDVRDMVHIFFWGRNNAGQIDPILSHFRAAVSYISSYTRRFLVVPYLPTRAETNATDAWHSRKALMDAVSQEWPDNALDLLPVMLAAYDPGTPQDVTDVANEVPPSTLMQADDTHPDAPGRVVEAQGVHDKIVEKGILS